MLNPVFQWMQVPSGPQTFYVVNGNMYVCQMGTVVQVQTSDVAALEALGWTLAPQTASVQLKAPPEVVSAAVGTNGYTVQPNGTITAYPFDVSSLVAAGFKTLA